MRRYLTVVIPPVPLQFRTEWHSDKEETLTRGKFHTPEEAIQWAKDHLRGCPYEIRVCGGES